MTVVALCPELTPTIVARSVPQWHRPAPPPLAHNHRYRRSIVRTTTAARHRRRLPEGRHRHRSCDRRPTPRRPHDRRRRSSLASVHAVLECCVRLRFLPPDGSTLPRAPRSQPSLAFSDALSRCLSLWPSLCRAAVSRELDGPWADSRRRMASVRVLTRRMRLKAFFVWCVVVGGVVRSNAIQ